MTQKGYQLVIKGEDDIGGGLMHIYSKNIYLHEPTEKEKEEFIKKCDGNNQNYITGIDLESGYELKVVEVNIVE